MSESPVFQQNPYQAPRTSLHDEDIRAEMAEILGKDVFLVRLLSVACFIVSGNITLNMLSSFSMELLTTLISLLYGIPLLLVMGICGISMHRYAHSAKRLRSALNVRDIADCFRQFNGFMKMMNIFLVLSMVFYVITVGIIVAGTNMLLKAI